eukprot:4990897-Amphidinium_carterae.1
MLSHLQRMLRDGQKLNRALHALTSDSDESHQHYDYFPPACSFAFVGGESASELKEAPERVEHKGRAPEP